MSQNEINLRNDEAKMSNIIDNTLIAHGFSIEPSFWIWFWQNWNLNLNNDRGMSWDQGVKQY